MKSSTITANDKFSIDDNNAITISRPDTRWWRRLWCFVTFKPKPIINDIYTVLSYSNNTITIGERK